MTAAEARKILSADKSFALVSLRGRSLADHELVLSIELARRKPRQRLTQRLQQIIATFPTSPTP